MADAGTMNFAGMDGETPETFVADDTNGSKWTHEDWGAANEAKSFLADYKESLSEKEATNLAAMLATQVDDQGHGLGDSRIFVKAVATAARQFNELLRKREGGTQEGGGKMLKFNMPIAASHSQRVALQGEARAILDRELMAARSEFIRRSGRSLPGWWR